MKRTHLLFVLFMFFALTFGSAQLSFAASPWDQTGVDPHHNWTIKFNIELDDTSINEDTIYVKNGTTKVEGNNLSPGTNMKSVTVKAPDGGYEYGKTYFLYIENQVKSAKGKALKEPIVMEFTIKDNQPGTQPGSLYELIYNGLLNVEPEIDTSLFSTESEVVFATLNQVLDENPEIYYFEHKGSLFWPGIGRFVLNYDYPKEEIMKMNAELEQTADYILSNYIKPGMSEFEKVKTIHDYLVLHTAYDHENYLKGTIPDLSYTIYGLLINGLAVCDGYAKSMVYLLDKLGIENYYVTGKAGGDLHAWNKVKVEGKWYNLDATWDDPTPDKEGYVRYKYFLILDSELAKDHYWDNAGLPDAVDTKYLFMADMWDFFLNDGYYYYSSRADNIQLYKIKTDGTDKTKISDQRANELVVYEDWIYFSNYSRGGYLYKMKTDGTGLTKLNDFHVKNLQLEHSTLYYTDANGTKEYQLNL